MSDAGKPLFSAQRWNELRALLQSLADADDATREAELARIAAGDAALAQSLRELLAETHDTLTPQPEQVVERLLPQAPTDGPARVGPFRLLRRIGAGGMGTIYLAEREYADFVQRVALKLLDGSSARLAHLASRELRVLAALAHPHITAFVDAGTQDGRAWLAMEYIDGIALLDYCREHALDVSDRVRLFDQVCAAVAHAHAQLVVHRDLKPSNVLVDAQGRAKLLDFGIALMLGDSEAAAPATRVFTPEYAAPEQLRGERATTATDVYSLGLILYELIAGRRLPTLERTAREGEWTTAELARFATTRELAANDKPRAEHDTRTLARLLRSDLGRIISHALAQDPARRYASVASLREDLARWLEHRPLTIGRPSFGYVAARFVRRHQVAVAIAAFAMAGLLALSIVALWQARVAQAQAQRATAVKDFLLDIFKRNNIANPDGAQARQTTAEQLLALGATRIRTQLRDVPDVRAELLGTIGQLYADMALSEPAIALYEEQIRTLRESHGAQACDGSVAEAQVALGAALTDAGRVDKAGPTLHDALRTFDACGDTTSTARANAHYYLGQIAYQTLPANDPTAVREFSEGLRIMDAYHPENPARITAVLGLARTAEYADDRDTAEKRYREALAYALASSDDERRLDAASAYQQLGDLLRKRQRFDEAEKDLRAAVATYSSAAGKDSPWTASAKQDLANLLAASGRRSEAEALLNEALQTTLRTRGAEDKELVPLMQLDLGTLQSRRGEWEAAAESLQASIGSTPPDNNQHAIALIRFGELLLIEGRLAHAATTINAAADTVSRLHGAKSASYARARLTQAELWVAQGDAARAAPVFIEVRAAWPASPTDVSPQFVQASVDLIQYQLASAQLADAVATGQALLEQIQSLPQAAALVDEEAQTRLWLGEAQRLSGNPQDALPNLQSAVSLRERLDDAQSPLLARARIAVAECLIDLHRVAEARALLDSAKTTYARHTQLAAWFTVPLASAQARLSRD